MEELNSLSDLAMWSLIVGAVLPVVVSAVKRSRWSNAVKALVAFAIFLIAGFGTAYFSGHLNGRTLVSATLLIMVTAYTLFQNFYKPTGIDAAISRSTEKEPAEPLG